MITLPPTSTSHDVRVSELPPPGWHLDPEGSGRLRWWDGQQWTDRLQQPGDRVPIVVPGPNGGGGHYRSVGGFLGHLFELAGGRAGPLFTIVAVTQVATSVLSTLLLYLGLRDLQILFSTDGRPDRLFEVAGFDTSAAVLLSLAALVSVLGGTWFLLAAQHHLWALAIGRPTEWRQSVTAGLRLIPRLFGWFLVVGAAMVAGFFAFVLVGALVGVAIGVLFFLAAVVFFIWAVVVVQFLPAAIVASPSPALRTCLAVVRGRWWATFGRTLLAGLMALAAILAFGVVTGIIRAVAGLGTTTISATDLGGGLERIDLIDLIPNLGAAVLLGIIGALQNSLSQLMMTAGLTSMFVDSGVPTEERRAGSTPSSSM